MLFIWRSLSSCSLLSLLSVSSSRALNTNPDYVSISAPSRTSAGGQQSLTVEIKCITPGTPAAYAGSADPGPSDGLHTPPVAGLRLATSPAASQSPAGTVVTNGKTVGHSEVCAISRKKRDQCQQDQRFFTFSMRTSSWRSSSVSPYDEAEFMLSNQAAVRSNAQGEGA